ncbi:GntR family transcriptional regulator [Rhodobacter sp. NTK016B]|uniref:GntR family transcriptional regulator n=1 Tax=Rhodobacter sp. NTK016B TaxID=2759676 RepID=UPI001A903DD5|nr:GntR family transcriptional regulator [Rhodobacter sp. NTK016B]MBN8291003.1 GntR family transcriptional regulator [Rhodobacter sp. NTK016B]
MSTPIIARIDPLKLRENVYFALRDAFTRGAFAPGDVLSLRTLADQLGVSMTPVREAVRRLVAEGALVDTPSRTLMVPAFDARRAADLKAARLALEKLVLDLAMTRMTSADIDTLEEILTRPKTGPAALPDLVANHDFHHKLYGFSESAILLPMIEALWLQYGAYLNLIINRPAAGQIDEHAHHHEIIAALRAGDRAKAHAALEDDITRSFHFLLP